MHTIAPVTPAQLLHPVQKMLYKLEIWDGSASGSGSASSGTGAWVDVSDYLISISISIGGPGTTPAPIAGTWSAQLNNKDGMFHPLHPTSAYADLLRIGREVRISVGAAYGGVNYYWQRLAGFMDAPRFNHGSKSVDIGGMDYMSLLANTILRDLNDIESGSGSGSGSGVTPGLVNGPTHWGAIETISTVETTKTFGAEKYIEDDALLCQPPGDDLDVNPVDWTTLHGTFISEAETGGGSDFVGHLETSGDFDWTSSTKSFGSIVNGKVYEVSFTYKRAASAPYDSGASMTLSLHNSSTNEIVAQAAGLTTTTAWTTVKFHFTAPYSCNTYMKFWIGPSAIDLPPYITVYYIDQLTFREVVTRVNTRYIMPATCNGPYFVALDGQAMWYGDEEDGWLYDETNKTFYFDDNAWIETGVGNLVIYYYTTQDVENVLADLLVWSGLYGSRADVLSDMDYTPTPVTIDRVGFESGKTTALEAVRMLCERVNYRFWFISDPGDILYGGQPMFKPAPVVGTPDFDFPDVGDLKDIGDFQDVDAVRNRIVIEGEKQAMFLVAREDKTDSRWKGEEHDDASVATYLERTHSILNHLFQDQDSVDDMCATLLAEFKDAKWYADLQLAFNPVPLELGDTITWVLQLAVGTFGALYGFAHYGVDLYATSDISVTVTGIIRAITINDGMANYKCEVVTVEPESGAESGSASASSS